MNHLTNDFNVFAKFRWTSSLYLNRDIWWYLMSTGDIWLLVIRCHIMKTNVIWSHLMSPYDHRQISCGQVDTTSFKVFCDSQTKFQSPMWSLNSFQYGRLILLIKYRSFLYSGSLRPSGIRQGSPHGQIYLSTLQFVWICKNLAMT